MIFPSIASVVPVRRAHGQSVIAALVTGVEWNAAHGLIVIAGYKFPNGQRAGPPSGLC